MDNTIKYASIPSVKAIEGEDRIIEFIASKEIPDYDNDIVKLDGLDITKIKKNKSFLWSHQQGMPPIGKIVKVWKDGNSLKGKAQLTSEEEYPFGYTIFKLIKGGYINNISISFLPDWKTIEYKEDKKGNRTQIINNSTLLECSAVNIGCNTGTSIEAKTMRKSIDDAWNSGVLNGIELNLMTDALDEIEKTPAAKEEKPEMDYEKEIIDLKEEIKELRSNSDIYKMFDTYDEFKDPNEEMYDEIAKIIRGV